MLEPTDIHSYEPPVSRTHPPSPSEGPPKSLPFACLVLESADARGGPSPALLHELREHGVKLVLAQIRLHAGDTRERQNGDHPGLNRQWFDAVFNKVLTPEDTDVHDSVHESALQRYWADCAITPQEALCFASSEEGACAFARANAGLVISSSQTSVCRRASTDDKRVVTAGADVAVQEFPSARQLAWLHKVFTEKLWCTCLWLQRPSSPAIFGIPGSSLRDRAEMTRVASSSMSALGHPPWDRWTCEGDRIPACTALVDTTTIPCADWTPLEPKYMWQNGYQWNNRRHEPKYVERDMCSKQVTQYCHSLDAGVAQVNHTIEVKDADWGLHARISSKRFVSRAREGHAATELCVVLLEKGKKDNLHICVSSSLRTDDIPDGYMLEKEVPEVTNNEVVLVATYREDKKDGDGPPRSIQVKAWHRVLKDDGRGDVRLPVEMLDNRSGLASDGGVTVSVKPHLGGLAEGPAIDIIVSNPRKGTRYTVEKVVKIDVKVDGVGIMQGMPTTKLERIFRRRPTRARMASSIPEDSGQAQDTHGPPPLLMELEEEHRLAWRAEWDRKDIEISGSRKAMRCQRAVRLFRFHQVSRGPAQGQATLQEDAPAKRARNVPDLVRQLFQAAFADLCVASEAQENDRPSVLVTGRVVVHDPRYPPVIKVMPQVPPACDCLRFNVALGKRWTRFTLTPGRVQILVQGQIAKESELSQLYHDTVRDEPKFLVHCNEGNEGVELKALPWHEVHVQHALTDLGSPDGSSGGFYGLMRRTRFTRVEVLRRLFSESDEHAADILASDEDVKQATQEIKVLRNALFRLESVPRPASWRNGDDHHLHVLRVDATTDARVMLSYEKEELQRDILFLEGDLQRHEGQLGGNDLLRPDDGSGDLGPRWMTVQEAKALCPWIPGCKGFTFQGEEPPQSEQKVQISFRDSGELKLNGAGWTSFRFTDGEAALLERLKQHHEEKLASKDWVETAVLNVKARATSNDWVDRPQSGGVVPHWDEVCDNALSVLDAVKSMPCDESPCRSDEPPFRNLVTDRDGTTNNYCARYSSSVQSAYNAAWLGHFAQECTANATFITAAPLGGRPSAEGLLELDVAPRGIFTYTGSKGREYFSSTKQRVLEADVLPNEQRELVEELHRRLLALCADPMNIKFLGIGSGLQRKFGEVTMARNDPDGTVPDHDSRRFMAAVRQLKEELDPDGTNLDLHDTGTDMELFPRSGERGVNTAFDKGTGLMRLDEKLNLRMELGPNLVCGDTMSDVSMLVTTLRLMCGNDGIMERWQAEVDREINPQPLPDEEASEADFGGAQGQESSAAELTPWEEQEEQRRREDEEEQKRQEEEDAAKEKCSRLAVIFVITPEAHKKKPSLAKTLIKWCETSGARLAFVPSPDVLVATLAKFANHHAKRRVTDRRTDADASAAAAPSPAGSRLADPSPSGGLADGPHRFAELPPSLPEGAPGGPRHGLADGHAQFIEIPPAGPRQAWQDGPAGGT